MNGVTCSRSWRAVASRQAVSQRLEAEHFGIQPIRVRRRQTCSTRSRRRQSCERGDHRVDDRRIDQRAVASDTHHGTSAPASLRRLVITVEHVVLAAAIDRVTEFAARTRPMARYADRPKWRARSRRRACAPARRSSSRPIIGVPHIGCMTLFGNRVEPMRAWTMATVFKRRSIETG